MNFKFLLVLFGLLSVTCMKSAGAQGRKAERDSWNDIGELEVLLRKRNNQDVIDKTLQKISDLQGSTVRTVVDDVQVGYVRRLLGLLVDAYLDGRQFTAGLACLDSLEAVFFGKENYWYDFPVGKARLCREMGNNRQAIQWVDEYLRLPECTDAEQFISYSEAISEVYVDCNNDVTKAIGILEKAVDAYHNGATHPHIGRVISRLGIYYRMKGEYEKAIAADQEAVDSCNDHTSPQDAVAAYGVQGNLYKELGLYEQALQQNTTALHYSLSSDSSWLDELYRHRAEIFSLTGQRDSVFHYLNLDGQASLRLNSFRGIFLNGIEKMKAYMDFPDSLQTALQIGLNLCSDTANIPKWAQYQLDFHLGQVLQRTGETQLGIFLIKKAAAGFVSINMVEMEEKANRILMDYFRQTKEEDAFMYYYNRNRLFVDSLRADEKSRAVAAATIRLDTEREKEKEYLLSTRLDMQEYQLFYSVCIFLILLIFLVGSIGYLIYKRKAIRLFVERSEREIRRLMTSRQELDQRNAQLAEQLEQVEINHNLMAIRQLTGQTLLSKEDENLFRRSFAALHPSYLPDLREHYPRLTRNEELLAMLICMNQSTDEIALIMGINRSSVNVVRSRMRKKMALSKEDSLDEVLKQYLS